MGTSEKPVQLKVYVDEKKKKVMFAEAEEDFVDILFSFMTLPLGTIAKISRMFPESKDIKVGSLTCLYESVANLDAKHFCWNKDILVNPRNSSYIKCQKLKIDLYESKLMHGTVAKAVFVKKVASFIITDNLEVLPLVLDTSIKLLNSLGVENINMLEERTMCFGIQEFLNLLKWSLVTDNPLTNLVFGGDHKPCSSSCMSITNSTNLASSESGQKVKLLVQKSKGKLLCAQVENFFVEMLFSFLTIPLGAFIRLTKDNSSPSGIINLYNSISHLGDENYLKSENVKTMLLSPKVADDYFRATDLLPVYEDKAHLDSFLMKQGTFIVSNDLEVQASLSMATMSNFNTLGVPIADMEVLEVSIGEHEALSLLRASLTSTSALTDCFSAFIKNHK